MKSNKTVDARGRSIKIKTSSQSITGFRMDGISNVILINLKFDNDYEDFEADEEGADAINIIDSHDIWIHHCEFSQWPDGAIDIKKEDSSPNDGDVDNVSVTWSRFYDIYQAMLWQGDHLSFGHNVCEGSINARCPKIVGGRGHSYNNYITDWGDMQIQAAKYGGQLYSQANIFESGSETDVNKRDASGDKIQNEDYYTIGTVTFVGGNDSVSSGFRSDSRSNANDTTCTNATCWTNMKNDLMANAGYLPATAHPWRYPAHLGRARVGQVPPSTPARRVGSAAPGPALGPRSHDAKKARPSEESRASDGSTRYPRPRCPRSRYLRSRRRSRRSAAPTFGWRPWDTG